MAEVDWEELGRPYLRQAFRSVVVHSAMVAISIAMLIITFVMALQTGSSSCWDSYLRYSGVVAAVIAVLAERSTGKLKGVIDPPGLADLKREKAKRKYGKFLRCQHSLNQGLTIVSIVVAALTPEILELARAGLSQSLIR